MQRSAVMSMIRGIGIASIVLAVPAHIGLGIVPLWLARASLDWTETRCHIQRSEVESDGDSYRANVVYTYDVNGIEYSGDRIDFAPGGSSNWSAGAAADVRRYRRGSDAPCWYNPDKPASSVLSRSAPATPWLLFPVIFGVIGFVFLQRGSRHSSDDAPGGTGSDGRRIYVRRCTATSVVIAIAVMWLVAAIAALLAITSSDSVGKVALPACAALAAVALVYELRAVLSVVTIVAPAELRGDEQGRAEWRVRSPIGSPRATASLIAVATTSGTNKQTSALSYQLSYEVTVETISTTPVDEDAGRPGTGTLRAPDDAPPSTPARRIDWFLEVHVHLPFGPDVTVRAPIAVPSPATT